MNLLTAYLNVFGGYIVFQGYIYVFNVKKKYCVNLCKIFHLFDI